MKTFALATLAAAAQATLMTTADYAFMNYITTHNKYYETVEEYKLRQEIFIRTELAIEELNTKNANYTAGHNKFSDWTQAEKDQLLGLKNMDLPEPYYPKIGFSGERNGSPIDWRTVDGVVTPVKDQGACGSCWAFSATETVESAWVIAGNEQVIMAPQELVDCAKSILTNHGCNGGWYYYAWDWLKTHKSMRESDYPYTSGTTGEETTCAYDESKGVTNTKGYVHVAEDTASIKAAIEQRPVSVAVSAGNDVFMYYTGGIITEDMGCPTRVDHAIQAVGWGSEGGQDYYIVRNSWSADWGEDGFVRIGTGSGAGTCGINAYVYSVTL